MGGLPKRARLLSLLTSRDKPRPNQPSEQIVIGRSNSRHPRPERRWTRNRQQAPRSRLRLDRLPRNSPHPRTHRQSRPRKQRRTQNLQSSPRNNPDRLHNTHTALRETERPPETQLRQQQPRQATRGGLETQAITEFVGEFGAGKSQICMKLSVMTQLPAKDGGLEGKVLFIDTEGTFAAQRVYQMATAMQLDPEKILDGIIYSRVYNSDHQILTVDHAFKICQEEKIKLLVVDSILSHFRGEYIGRESLSERQQRLNSHLHKLLRIAQPLNLPVDVTNQAQANPQAFFGDPTRPAGGNILAHASTHRVMLKKASQGLRVAKIIDSPYLPESEAYFQITEKGVEDAAPKNRRDD